MNQTQHLLDSLQQHIQTKNPDLEVEPIIINGAPLYKLEIRNPKQYQTAVHLTILPDSHIQIGYPFSSSTAITTINLADPDSLRQIQREIIKLVIFHARFTP